MRENKDRNEQYQVAVCAMKTCVGMVREDDKWVLIQNFLRHCHLSWDLRDNEAECGCQSENTPESQILSQKELGIKNQKEAKVSGAEGSIFSVAFTKTSVSHFFFHRTAHCA